MDNRTIDEVRRNEDRLINKIELLEKENQELKNQKQEWIDLLNMFKNQQKEFIRWLEKEIVDSKTEGSQQYYAMQHLRLFKEIIGDK